MSAIKVTLDPPLHRFAADQVASGAYPDVEAVLRAGVERLREDDARQTRFDTLVQEGLDDLAAGRSEAVDDIGVWLDGLGRRKPE